METTDTSDVRLFFRLPRTECKVETTGTIMRVMRDAGKQRAACRFDNLNSTSLQATHDFVTSSAGGDDSVPAWAPPTRCQLRNRQG